MENSKKGEQKTCNEGTIHRGPCRVKENHQGKVNISKAGNGIAMPRPEGERERTKYYQNLARTLTLGEGHQIKDVDFGRGRYPSPHHILEGKTSGWLTPLFLSPLVLQSPDAYPIDWSQWNSRGQAIHGIQPPMDKKQDGEGQRKNNRPTKNVQHKNK